MIVVGGVLKELPAKIAEIIAKIEKAVYDFIDYAQTLPQPYRREALLDFARHLRKEADYCRDRLSRPVVNGDEFHMSEAF